MLRYPIHVNNRDERSTLLTPNSLIDRVTVSQLTTSIPRVSPWDRDLGHEDSWFGTTGQLVHCKFSGTDSQSSLHKISTRTVICVTETGQ